MSALPPEIGVHESPSGVRYRLPRRPPSRLRSTGMLMVGPGVALAAVPLLFAWLFSFAGLPGAILHLACNGPIFIPLGASLAVRGLIILVGHAEVAVREDQLHMTERWGLLGWTRRLPLDRVIGFRVVHGDKTLPGAKRGAGRPGEWANLLADLSPGKEATVVWCYPREWLLALADDLALRCVRVPVADVSADPLLIQDRPAQPTDSDAVLLDRPDGVTIVFPPSGLRFPNALALLVGCVGLNLLVLLFTAVMVPAMLLGHVTWEWGKGKTNPLNVCVGLALLWAVGVGSVVYLLQRSCWRAALSVTGPTLELAEGGAFGRRRFRWAVADLADVRVVSDPDSGGVDRTRWEFALALQTSDGQLFRTLSHRPKAELEWAATVVRQAIRSRAAPPAETPGASEGIQKPARGVQAPGA